MPPEVEEQTLADFVPISKTFVDAYTRPVSEARVNKILRSGFSEDKLGVILLSLRADGRYAILDGNHRVQAARKAGVTHIYARVYIDKTYEEEAELFDAFNRVNRPTALDRFRARLAMKEENALEIARILREFNLEVAITGPGIGRITAVSALDRLYDEQGGTALREVVEILFRTWGTERRAWIMDMIDGMRQFWMRYRADVDKKRLIDRLSLTTPERVLAEAGASIVYAEGKGTLIGRTITNRYNAGLRNKLPQWVDHPSRQAGGKKREKKA